MIMLDGLPSQSHGNFDKALVRLGNPHKKMRLVIVAGANGKSSTCSMIAQILQSAGYKVGLLATPFVERPSECFFVDGQSQFPDRIEGRIKSIVSQKLLLSSSEVLSLAALELFAYERCEWAVLEASHYKDSLASCVPNVLVITDVEKVGAVNSADIAQEFTAFIHPNVPLVTGAVGQSKKILFQDAMGKRSMMVSGEPYDYQVGLLGDYQLRNAGLAYEAARLLEIPNELIRQGIKNAWWPMCIQQIKGDVYLDCADTPSRVKAVSEFMVSLGKPLIVVISIAGDAKPLVDSLPPCMEVILTSECDAGIPHTFIPDKAQAISHALASKGKDDVIFILGDKKFIRDAQISFGARMSLGL